MSEKDLRTLVREALDEDIGTGDITTGAVVPADARARGFVAQQEPGVVFGYEVAEAVFRELDPEVAWSELEPEGVWHDDRINVARVEGAARALLMGERVALNFLQRLSGIATLTARFVRAVEGTDTEVLDTRKTTPCLRQLEKEAVRAGGGLNHRMGLYDAVLVKDNHIEIAGGVAEAVSRALRGAPKGMMVEVECVSLDQVREAVEAGARRLLLDNMGVDEIKETATLAEGKAELEASGGIDLDRASEIAATPVQYISVGALTHSAPALDLNMKIQVI